MPNSPWSPTTGHRCDFIAGDPPSAQPTRFDSPFDALNARLDACELELLVKLNSLESRKPLPPVRLPIGEIVRIVAITALACIAAIFFSVWLWRR